MAKKPVPKRARESESLPNVASPPPRGRAAAEAAVVAAADEALAVSTPDPSRSRPRPHSPQDSEEESVSSDESGADTAKDPPELRRLAGYNAAKRHYRGKLLPFPFGWQTPSVLKDPRLWPLLWESQELTQEDITSRRGLPGEVAREFDMFLELAYVGQAGTKQVLALFRMLASLWLVSESEEWYQTLGREAIRSVTAALVELDGEYLSSLAGARAGAAYREARRVDSGMFAADALGAVRIAVKRGRGSSSSFPGHDKKSCSKCGKTVQGSFKEHNTVCRKK